MREGIARSRDPRMQPEKQRPELSPHYDDTKRQLDNGISFCFLCSDPTCSCNKQIIQLWATTCEVIGKLRSLEEGPIKLSIFHFFTNREVEYFLTAFTEEWNNSNIL